MYEDSYPPLAPVRSAPPLDLFTLDEIKAHLRVDSDDEDDYIKTLTDAAIQRCDGWSGVLGRCLMEQTWVQSYRAFSCSRLRLPLRPVTSITTVKYYDSSNVLQTFSSASYRLLTDFLSPYVGLVVNGQWPSSLATREDAVEVTFKAGYATAAAVPAPVKHLIKLMIGDWYEHRETVAVGVIATEIPLSASAQALIAQFKAGSF